MGFIKGCKSKRFPPISLFINQHEVDEKSLAIIYRFPLQEKQRQQQQKTTITRPTTKLINIRKKLRSNHHDQASEFQHRRL
jgi:hypothetical protein